MGEIFDVLVIGAGPGGYTAAIKAAKEGLRTAVVEKERAGGTCLNRGCIPTKAMLNSASLYQEVKNAERFGIISQKAEFDYRRILKYREETIDKLCQGVERLFKENGVTLIRGKGILEKERHVRVAKETGEDIYEGKNIILAAGSKPLCPRIPGIDAPGVLTSDGLFRMHMVPESLLIIGGGVIGVEAASIFSDLGCRVTIVEALPRLIPNMDREISQNLRMVLKKRGIKIYNSAEVQCIEKDGEEYTCIFTENGRIMEESAQYILCAVGRCPNTQGLFGEEAAPEMKQGYIIVDQNFRTSIKGVYAIGDLIKGRQLAHLASAQGKCAVGYITGKEPSIDLLTIPECVYTNPEIASAGLTEEEAKSRGLNVKIGRFNMGANGKSIITGEERGFIKVVAEDKSDVIVGAQMMCARATDMIGEFVTAIVNRLTVKQLIKGMRAHPTYNEGVTEALENICGKEV